MVNVKIVEEKPINMAELKEYIKKIKKRDEELGFRAAKTEDFLNQFVELKAKDAKELAEKLEGLNISRLRAEHINKLIDILPESAEEVKSTLQGYSISVKQEDLKKISDVIADYLPKKK